MPIHGFQKLFPFEGEKFVYITQTKSKEKDVKVQNTLNSKIWI